jgi:hypothetical protein
MPHAGRTQREANDQLAEEAVRLELAEDETTGR